MLHEQPFLWDSLCSLLIAFSSLSLLVANTLVTNLLQPASLTSRTAYPSRPSPLG